MISYLNCQNVDPNKIYEAFSHGFSDYLVKMEKTKEEFFNIFFGVEGNDLKYSFIALDGEKAVGLILGGIKDYEGIKTIRCGALCVHPDYRGRGISHELFRLHKELAIKNDCKQMILEVIVENHRAIKFYQKQGYEIVYILKYYTCKDLSKIEYKINCDISIKEIDFDEMLSLNIRSTHINWQNDFDYIIKLGNIKYYGAYKDDTLIGALTISKEGRIFTLFVDEKYRLKGVGRGLLNKAIEELNVKVLTISFPSNASLEGFARKMNFQKEKLFQYEMYLTI